MHAAFKRGAAEPWRSVAVSAAVTYLSRPLLAAKSRYIGATAQLTCVSPNTPAPVTPSAQALDDGSAGRLSTRHALRLVTREVHERLHHHPGLAAFGIGPEQLFTLPRCSGFPDLSSDEAMLGALYVVEGSALGGIALARSLEGLVGHGALDGRRFFNGHGSRTGDAWRAYLFRLANASHRPEHRATIIATALATFALFEQWIEGWEDRND